MVLHWLEASLADLRAIKAYIAEENPDAARRVIASIRSETNILTNQPVIGRAGRIADTRELVISQYPYLPGAAWRSAYPCGSSHIASMAGAIVERQ